VNYDAIIDGVKVNFQAPPEMVVHFFPKKEYEISLEPIMEETLIELSKQSQEDGIVGETEDPNTATCPNTDIMINPTEASVHRNSNDEIVKVVGIKMNSEKSESDSDESSSESEECDLNAENNPAKPVIEISDEIDFNLIDSNDNKQDIKKHTEYTIIHKDESEIKKAFAGILETLKSIFNM
jgi:hypothetical protein